MTKSRGNWPQHFFWVTKLRRKADNDILRVRKLRRIWMKYQKMGSYFYPNDVYWADNDVRTCAKWRKMTKLTELTKLIKLTK